MLGTTRNAADDRPWLTASARRIVPRSGCQVRELRPRSRFSTPCRNVSAHRRTHRPLMGRARRPAGPARRRAMNGSRQPPGRDSRPAGTPSTDATENAPITAPIARPRRSGGIDVGDDRVARATWPGRRRRPRRCARASACRSPRANAPAERAEHEPEHRDAERLAPIEAIEEERAGEPATRTPPRCSCRRRSRDARRGMPSARAKSGPSGITIMKSRMLTNWTAPTRNTRKRSETARAPVAGGAAVTFTPFACARAGSESSSVAQRRKGLLRARGRSSRWACRRSCGPGRPRLFGEAHQPLQAVPHRRRVAAREIGAAAAAHEHHVARDDVAVRQVAGAAHGVAARSRARRPRRPMAMSCGRRASTRVRPARARGGLEGVNDDRRRSSRPARPTPSM